MLRNKKIKYAIIVLSVIVAGFVYLFTVNHKSNMSDDDYFVEGTIQNIQDESADTSGGNELFTTANENIYVYVSGYVKTPGVYEVAKESRVVTAIEAAGGFLDEADTSLINLARIVEDGEHIHIYSVNDNVKPQIGEIKNGESENGLININTATKDMLITLPGIGSSKAESIIAYRDKNGRFSSCEDIMNVAGIKESAYEKIKDLICVE